MLTVLKSMYSSVKSRVKFNHMLSNEFSGYLGVRQGESLSPFLFAMFLNDIEDHLISNGFDGIEMHMIKMFILLYADDIVIFSNSADGLQGGLDSLLVYCNRWKLKLNVDKTKVIIFRKSGSLPRHLSFSFNGEQIEIIKSFSYLGIIFTQGGSFSETQAHLADKAQKAIFKLNKYLYNFPNVTVKHRLDLFDKLILPILNYSCEVWGFHKASNIERIHTQYCKRILNVKLCAQNDFVYGIMGRHDLMYNRSIRIIKYWLKIISCADKKYCKRVYDVLKLDAESYPNKVSWVTLLRNMLSIMGFHDVWLQQGVGNVNIFLIMFKQRLQDISMQNWSSRLEDSTRSTFFRSIVSFQFQFYLKCDMLSHLRVAMNRLICSSHNLCIETGRWHRPHSIPRENRKCTTCNKIEDEYHFLVECTRYKDLRKKYIPKYYWSNPSMFKVKMLFELRDESKIKQLCTYIYKAFEVHKTLE